MSITIRVWDLWVRLEKYVNLHLGKRVRKILQAREVAKADAFLKKFRSDGGYTGQLPQPPVYVPPVKLFPPSKCKHLKGGSRFRAGYKDYNLAMHTFSDGRTKVWCLFGCGLEAWTGDTNFENLRKLMEEKSSNHRSSSAHFVTLRNGKPIVAVQDRIPNGRT